jgi:hypothetical protein
MARRRNKNRNKNRNQKPSDWSYQEPQNKENYFEWEFTEQGKATKTKVWVRKSTFKDMNAVADDVMGGMVWRARDHIAVYKN